MWLLKCFFWGGGLFCVAAVVKSLVPCLPSSCGSDEVKQIRDRNSGRNATLPPFDFLKSPSGSSRAETERERASEAETERASESEIEFKARRRSEAVRSRAAVLQDSI